MQRVSCSVGQAAVVGGARSRQQVALLTNDRRLRVLLLGGVLLGASSILSSHRLVPDLLSDADLRSVDLLVGGKGWPAGVWWEHRSLKQYQVRRVLWSSLSALHTRALAQTTSICKAYASTVSSAGSLVRSPSAPR